MAVPLALIGSEAGHAAGNLMLGFPMGPSGEVLQQHGPGASHLGALAVAAALVLLAGFVARAMLGEGRG